MILTWYILKEHIRPFLYSLLIITFILVMDYIITVIDLIIRKGVDILTVLELFFYNLAWMTALSVPMAVLVATLMAFGRLSADNEITAIKTSGTSLYRIIRPVLIGACCIAAGLIVFNDRVLPNFNLQVKNLLIDIKRKRPAMEIKAGIFITEIPGYSILIDHVDEKTSDIAGITINEHRNRTRPRTITARNGNLRFSPDGNRLILDLFDGEMHEVNEKNPKEYQRVSFKRHTLTIDDVGSDLERTNSAKRRDREMTIAMMHDQVRRYRRDLGKHRAQLSRIAKNDIIPGVEKMTGPGRRNRVGSQLQRYASMAANDKKQMNRYLVEIHKKYSIPVACVVFVLIGAPLGIMARRGGIAIGAGMSLGFFLIYWAFLIGGEDLADRGILSPFWAMWTANFILGGIGIWLIRSTVRETRFINWSVLARLNLFARKRFRGQKTA